MPGPNRHALRGVLVAAIASATILSGCAAAATPSPLPTVAPSPSAAASPSASAVPTNAPTPAPTATPTPTPVATPSPKPIVLRQAPANLGCDTIGVDYTRMTFKIDPNAAEQVVAIANTGTQLLTYWSAGFKPGTDAGGKLAILDPAGKVVVTDGQVLDKPAAAYPRLAGYFVCLGTAAIYVLIADPS